MDVLRRSFKRKRVAQSELRPFRMLHESAEKRGLFVELGEELGVPLDAWDKGEGLVFDRLP